MRQAYLDNSATTAVCRSAADRALEAMVSVYGNPSSLHAMGVEAEEQMEHSRGIVAKALHSDAKEIVFTSGGTEANNLALFGAAKALARRGRRVVTTAAEHPSVEMAVNELKKQGFEVVRVGLLPDGRLDIDALHSAITADTILVSVMMVNNETGAVFPVREAADAIKKSGAPALLHSDAVQAFGKILVDPHKQGIDLLSFSGHKIHAPKGVGGLFVRRGVHIHPMLFGGGQESGRRPGTESVPLIAALGAAVEELRDFPRGLAHATELRDRVLEGLRHQKGITINSPDDALPYLLNLSIAGVRSEIMLHFLESKGVYVSSGSACSHGKGSRVLAAQGLSAARVDGALRLSFSRMNTIEDIDRFLEALQDGLTSLRRGSNFNDF